MSGFTKGPWRVGNHGSVVSDWPVAEIPSTSDDIQFYGGHVICETITPSNARFVAASPDVFEALQSITEYVDSILDGYRDQMEVGDRVLGYQFMKLAKDAIDKATKEPANAAPS